MIVLGKPAFGGQNYLASPTSRIRPVNEKAATLLRAGCARSATFRRLTELIEQSDLVVFVGARPLPTLAGQLHFVGVSTRGRYLIVCVRQRGPDNELVPWLAHELWHAIEIARTTDVREAASFRRFYERTGEACRGDNRVQVEANDARAIQSMVLCELRQTASAPRKRHAR